MKKLILFIFIALLLSSSLFSQVGIFPQVVFLDARNRSGDMKIMNSTDEPKEVFIDLKFGYPGSDSNGLPKLVLSDTVPEVKFSACPYVKIFPKKLVLKGKEEQSVKFMLGNIGNLPDGTYFGRVIIVSQAPPQKIDSTFIDGKNIRARIDVRYTLMSALIFEKGKRDCRLKVINSGYFADSTNLNVVIGYERTGNSPFWGTAELNVFDTKGNKVAELKEISPIYFSSKKAYKFDRSKFQPGQYRVDLKLTNEHKDVPDDFKIPFEPLKESFYINISEHQN